MPKFSSASLLVAKEDCEHIYCLRRLDGFENDAIPARHLAVVAFVVFLFERLHEATEGVFFECGDIVKDALPRSGGIALCCLAAPS
jgi:hypothetical protein